MKKSCAVMVSYNRVPRLDLFLDAILRADLDVVIVSDNSTESHFTAEIEEEARKFPSGSAIIINNHGNKGISVAINSAVKIGDDYGCFYYYLLDDDAIISKDFFRIEKEYYFKVFDETKNRVVICPIVSNNHDQLNSIPSFISNEVDVINCAITSGILIDREVFTTIGGYDESFFLERADFALSEKLKQMGFSIHRINIVLIVQNFGLTLKDGNFRARLFMRLFRLLNVLDFKIFNSGNSIRFFQSVYPPERYEDMFTAERKIQNTYRNKSIFLYIVTSILIDGLIKQLFLFFITGDSEYLKSLKGFLK